MARIFHRNLTAFLRKYRFLVLAFFYFSGLLTGAVYSLRAGSCLDPLMRGAPGGPVSIVGLLCVSVVPFLFSAFAVYISHPELLLLVSFADAFVFSFVSASVIRCFGSAGWLVRLLLCFSGWISMPVLYLYWLRHLTGKENFGSIETAAAFCVCFLIGSVDFRVISPFLAKLING